VPTGRRKLSPAGSRGKRSRALLRRIDPEQSRYTCMLPEHKPVRRGREVIYLLAVEEPKPKPAKIRAVSY
jgi:hypothetical protein